MTVELRKDTSYLQMGSCDESSGGVEAGLHVILVLFLWGGNFIAESRQQRHDSSKKRLEDCACFLGPKSEKKIGHVKKIKRITR
jgi:hypothetical protein